MVRAESKCKMIVHVNMVNRDTNTNNTRCNYFSFSSSVLLIKDFVVTTKLGTAIVKVEMTNLLMKIAGCYSW